MSLLISFIFVIKFITTRIKGEERVLLKVFQRLPVSAKQKAEKVSLRLSGVMGVITSIIIIS